MLCFTKPENMYNRICTLRSQKMNTRNQPQSEDLDNMLSFRHLAHDLPARAIHPRAAPVQVPREKYRLLVNTNTPKNSNTKPMSDSLIYRGDANLVSTLPSLRHAVEPWGVDHVNWRMSMSWRITSHSHQTIPFANASLWDYPLHV